MTDQTIELKSVARISPQMIAQLFAGLDSEKQADVFEEIGRISNEEWKHGQMQWAYLGQELLKRGTSSYAWGFAADIGAFTMNHSFRLLEDRERALRASL